MALNAGSASHLLTDERGVRPHFLVSEPELTEKAQFYVHMGQGAARPLNSRTFNYLAY